MTIKCRHFKNDPGYVAIIYCEKLVSLSDGLI